MELNLDISMDNKINQFRCWYELNIVCHYYSCKVLCLLCVNKKVYDELNNIINKPKKKIGYLFILFLLIGGPSLIVFHQKQRS